MRCSEARQRLIKFRGSAPDDTDGRELLKHLRDCPACAAFARAEQALARDFSAAKETDIADDIPLSTLKTRVESRVRLGGGKQAKERSIMGVLIGPFKKRPRLGLSLGVVAIVLALATLIPFTLEQTVGYEVALAGVDKDLAMDSYRVQELLAALGVGEATFDIGDCEATCKVKISDLKTEDDVKLVVAAFDEMGECVLEEIREISGDGSGSLLDHAKNVIFIRKATVQLDGDDMDEVHEIVIERLGTLDSCGEGAFSIWMSDDGDDVDVHKVMIAGDSNCVNWHSEEGIDYEIAGDHMMKKVFVIGNDGDGTEKECVIDMIKTGDDPSAEHLTVNIEELEDGTTEMVVTMADGTVHRFDVEDEDLAEKLEALGITAKIMKSGDGTQCEVFICKQDGEGAGMNKRMEALHEAHKGDADQVPDEIGLTQNYPNPFNPTTTISYNVTESQHVTLEIFNVNGQKVKTLVDEVVSVGDHSVIWDSTDENGQKVASGIYMYRLTAGDIVETKKMTLLK